MLCSIQININAVSITVFKAKEPQKVNCKELKDKEKTIISTCGRPDMELTE